jgi:3-oxoacyl-[acyl-carrier protein] reductase
MDKRVILVTGGNGQLGSEIGRFFLTVSANDIVWLAIHRNSERVEELTVRFPGRCKAVSLDVTRQEDWKGAVERIAEESGPVGILVNNAGKHDDALLANMPVETWNDVLQTNLQSVFLGCQAVLPQMISQRRGRIINIASLSALLPPPGQTNYAAAKAGVVALTQSLAKEVARIGITVNAICPGYLETEVFTNLPEAQLDEVRRRIPMRRLGRPEEVAAAVFFLATEAASYITGSSLKIDGGLL